MRTRVTIDKLRDSASQLQLELLSKKYYTITTKYKFKCENGHIIYKAGSSIRGIKPSGCYKCNRRIKEELCRFAIENLTGFDFPPNKKLLRGLELDGYNDELKIAFEYQGEQHYRYIQYWHKSMNNFIKNQNRDQEKRNRLSAKSIHLIEIPYWERTKENIEQYIRQALIHQTDLMLHKIDWNKFRGKPAELEKVRKACQKKKLELLDNTYINARTKMQCRCLLCGETSKYTPDVLINRISKNGMGCKSCSLSKSWRDRCHTLEEMKDIAISRGGTCISDHINTAKDTGRWVCKKGHMWENTFQKIFGGQWCPKCSAVARGKKIKKFTINDLKKYALTNNGECLSCAYSNTNNKYLWKCNKGHIWECSWGHIKNGYWCPFCNSTKTRGSIEEINTIAIQKMGRCLSAEYKNQSTKLLFECEYKHQWYAAPNKIKIGRWCPVCANKQRWNTRGRTTIEDMKKLARENHGQCLSNKYVNMHYKLLWECNHKHTWHATPSSVKYAKRWCPECRS